MNDESKKKSSKNPVMTNVLGKNKEKQNDISNPPAMFPFKSVLDYGFSLS